MADIEWRNDVLHYVPSDGQEHWLGGVKVNPGSGFTERQDALFAAFIAGFTTDGRESDVSLRGSTMPVLLDGSTWHIPMFAQISSYNDRSFYLCDASGRECMNQIRFMDSERNARSGFSFTYAVRFMISDWWPWSCDCSTQIYVDPNLVGALSDWNNTFGNDAAFSIDIHSGFWNGRQEGYEWNTIYPNSGAEWRQIHWDGDSPTWRGYGASPPDTLGLNQLNAQGNWQRRIEWTTGLGGDGAFSGNVYGNGEYWPRDTMTCNIKNMLPTV